MKIIFLNCWHGQVLAKLLSFLENNKQTIDILCLQEVPPKLNFKLKEIFKEYKNFYECLELKKHKFGYYGQSIFIKKTLQTHKYTVSFPFINRRPNYGFLQNVQFEYKNKKFLVSNFHGRSQPGHKLDTPTRILQSKNIIRSLKNDKISTILGGDFNLEPNTKSLKIIVNSGLINLIDKFSIKTTRNKIAWNEALENHKMSIAKFYKKQKFADYCFVSENINVKSFEVPNVLISDHLPLILDIEV